MIAIGSTTSAVSQSASASSGVALRADLARYQKQLADCVNCESAKTPEGKRNIQDLSRRIDGLKAKLNVVPQSAAKPSLDESTTVTGRPSARNRVDVYA